jgi:hypothetical protein
MWWLGLIIGLFVGCNLAVGIVCLVRSKNNKATKKEGKNAFN